MAYPYRIGSPDEQRAVRGGPVGSDTAPARMRTQAQVLLGADQVEGGPGWSDAAIATAFNVNPSTVLRVRNSFLPDRAAA